MYAWKLSAIFEGSVIHTLVSKLSGSFRETFFVTECCEHNIRSITKQFNYLLHSVHIKLNSETGI
jgi:hypothetical protein